MSAGNIAALLGLLLGETTLYMDIGSRLFGSCRRTPLGSAVRIFVMVAAMASLAAPACLLALYPNSHTVQTICFVAAALGVLLFLHFLFPYKFGIRKVAEGKLGSVTTSLTPVVALREQAIEHPDLPSEMTDFALLVISDLHCNTGRSISILKDCVDALTDAKPDCVAILGDFGEKGELLPAVIEILDRIPSRLGAFCVRGNHDFEDGRADIIEESVRETSISLLANSARRFPDLRLSLLGVESPWNSTPLPEPPQADFVIGLTHSPDNIPLLARSRVSLGLAGHTHGGKMRLPIVGPLMVPCALGRFLDGGLYALGNTLTVVTKGIGHFPGGGNRQGEILLLTLARRRQP